MITLKIKESEAKDVLAELINAATSLEMEKDLTKALGKLLSSARQIVGASAGTLYLIEGDKLKISACQNDEIDVAPIIEMSKAKGSGIPLNHESIAGFSVVSGEVVHVPNVNEIDVSLPYQFNSKVDKKTGFTSKSILAIPVKHPSEGIIGTLELFNPDDGEFEEWNIGVLESFAMLAAVTIINIKLRESLKDSYLETVFRLGIASEFKDDDTYDHIQRIRYTSKLIARSLGLSDEDQGLIFHASSMHDIGKIGVPDRILKKRGKLDDDEWVIMRSHPEMGRKILEDTSSEILQVSEKIALYHHEKWNGKGYPEGLAGEDIPLFARIVAVADVFDALVQARVYKPAWKVQKALDLIKSESGAHFDPSVVEAFFQAIDAILEVQGRFGELQY